MLFDLQFFRSLKLLSIITKRHFRGEKIGHRRSLNRGASAEFAEFKEYIPGDDLRFIDWNLYGRLEKLYIKKFHSEEELSVSILLDCSKSMDYGNPSKFDHARKLAAAIAYVAIQNQDTSRIYSFSDDIESVSDAFFRRGHIRNIMGFLEGRTSAGMTRSFEELSKRFILKQRRPGVVFVLTDGMIGSGLFSGLKRLAHRKFEVNLVQILSPEEMNPDLAGLVELTDSENGKKVSVSVNNNVLTIYEEVLRDCIDELKTFLIKHGMNYIYSLTSAPFESTLLNLFANKGKEF